MKIEVLKSSMETMSYWIRFALGGSWPMMPFGGWARG